LRTADASAKQNLALCERLLADNAGAATLSREIQVQLVYALLGEGRRIEVAPLALLLGKGQDIAEQVILARLKEYTSQQGWTSDRLKRQPNGMFSLGLYRLALGDLSLLKDLPIAGLDVSGTALSDLSPLACLPLTRLNFAETSQVPLHRCPESW